MWPRSTLPGRDKPSSNLDNSTMRSLTKALTLTMYRYTIHDMYSTSCVYDSNSATNIQVERSLPDNKAILEELKKEDILKSHIKKLMPFIQKIKVCLKQ